MVHLSSNPPTGFTSSPAAPYSDVIRLAHLVPRSLNSFAVAVPSSTPTSPYAITATFISWIEKQRKGYLKWSPIHMSGYLYPGEPAAISAVQHQQMPAVAQALAKNGNGQPVHYYGNIEMADVPAAP
ncbi:hypothetical protein HK405_015351, partial [Cladochytrium tenue]